MTGEQLALDLGAGDGDRAADGDGDDLAVVATVAVDVVPDAAARQRIATETARTLFVEAGAGAGKTSALVGRIVQLVDEGIEMQAIAAITFTEKAAAELRHRLRAQLTAVPSVIDPAAADRRARARAELDHAPVGTLHAFARRLLLEFPVEAGLPPGFDVLDDLESDLALGERYQDLVDELFDDPDRLVAPGLCAREFAVLVSWDRFKPSTLRGIVDDFQANWDLVDERVEQQAPAPPDVAAAVAAIVGEARAIAAESIPDGDRQRTHVDTIGLLAERIAATPNGPGQLEALTLLAIKAERVDRVGNANNWKSHGGPAALKALRQREQELANDVQTVLGEWREYRRLTVGAIVGHFVLVGAEERARNGGLEFHDLLVLARRLLNTSRTARRALHGRYQRVLLDEFQDTDPIQLEIAIRLTAEPTDEGRDLQPLPGRLFVVGDPKQSIYRFRRADIGAYLVAAERIAADEVHLSANFRSSRAVIDWVNGVFSSVISEERGIQPAYRPLDVARPGSVEHGSVWVLGADVHDPDVNADELRRSEAADVTAAVVTALRQHWQVGDGDRGLRSCRPGDIAILLPARTSLPMLEAALSALGVPYRAENAGVVYLAAEIRDVMLALRAAADSSDELALVAALRSPLYGCSDVELYDWRRGGGSWNLFAEPPDGLAEHPVAVAIDHVASIARRVTTTSPADLVDAVVTERRVLEVALGGADARDVWRRVRYVVDQARAWVDAGGRGLRRYLAWTRYQAAEGRASDTILPEYDHDAVRIMTVHAAKGLEFPITIVAGLTTRRNAGGRVSAVWPPDGGWTLAERDDLLFQAFKPLDEQMGDAERRRLLYVACTRAVDHLVVSLHRKPESEGVNGRAGWTSAGVLAAEGAAEFGAAVFDEAVEALASLPAEPTTLAWDDPTEWDAERQRLLADAARRTTTSATRVAAGVPLAVAVGAGRRHAIAERHDAAGDAALVEDPRPVDHGDDPDPVDYGDDDPGPAGDGGAPPVDAMAGGADDGDALSLVVDVGLAKDPVDLDLPPWQRGRYGTAVGRAVHAVLQDADLAAGRDIDELARTHVAAEGIFALAAQVAALARSALGAPIVEAVAAGAEHWRELFVVTELGGVVLEGYVDLLVRTPDGLVIVDYKTDHLAELAATARAERLGRYRIQLAAYGVALATLLDEPIVGGVLVHCLPDAPAEQLAVPDWDEALQAVRASTG